MSREIKFRFKFPNGETVYVSLEEISQDRTGLYDMAFYKGQYTGLKDKNGKEIYEGDIFERNKHIGYVRYFDERAKFGVLFDDNKVIELFRSTKWSWFIEDEEVIGNIYENPELLESK